MPKELRARAFFGTWNSYPVDWKAKFDVFEKYVAQMEIGETHQTQHIQWCGVFKSQRTFDQVKKLFPGSHIEKARNWNACINYCKKDKTYGGERIEKPLARREVIDPLAGKEFNAIQRKIIEIIKDEPSVCDRTIHWVYDPKGGCGKTSLAKHLCIKNKDVLYVSGKSADMKFGVMEWIDKRDLRVAIINLTKTIENYVSYQGIEEIKDGIFYNVKYESGMCIFNPPHVIVMANFMPNEDALSADRWNIIEVDDEEPRGQYDIMLDAIVD